MRSTQKSERRAWNSHPLILWGCSLYLTPPCGAILSKTIHLGKNMSTYGRSPSGHGPISRARVKDEDPTILIRSHKYEGIDSHGLLLVVQLKAPFPSLQYHVAILDNLKMHLTLASNIRRKCQIHTWWTFNLKEYDINLTTCSFINMFWIHVQDMNLVNFKRLYAYSRPRLSITSSQYDANT